MIQNCVYSIKRKKKCLEEPRKKAEKTLTVDVSDYFVPHLLYEPHFSYNEHLSVMNRVGGSDDLYKDFTKMFEP